MMTRNRPIHPDTVHAIPSALVPSLRLARLLATRRARLPPRRAAIPRAVTVDALSEVLSHTRCGRMRTNQLLLPHSEENAARFASLCDEHPRVSMISVRGAPKAEVIDRGGWVLRSFPERIESSDQCGRIHPGYFHTNLTSFSEAQRFNSCLNGNLGVDVDGTIKNCPSCLECFGNARTHSLRDAVEQPGFQKPWKIRRDEVEVCRDCEYRYICTDCRVFVRDPDDPRSKPSKCGCDPYSDTWGAPATPAT